MNNYTIKQSFKTKFLNIFRLLFTLPFFEKMIVKKSLNGSTFFKKLIPPDYLYKKNSTRLIYRDGINYELDISNVVDHYLYFGMEENAYKSIEDIIKNAKIIFDIGANIGTTSLFFASLNSVAQIFAFEPHPKTLKKIQKNLSLNKFKNIEIINVGLGEKKETLKLYEVNSNNPGMNRILANEINFPFVSIQIDTIDTIFNEKNIDNVDFIKIDVEGFEYAVLAGGKNTITKFKPVLFIELNDNNIKANNKSAKELIDLLIEFGYTKIYRSDNLESIIELNDFNNCHFDIIAK